MLICRLLAPTLLLAALFVAPCLYSYLMELTRLAGEEGWQSMLDTDSPGKTETT